MKTQEQYEEYKRRNNARRQWRRDNESGYKEDQNRKRRERYANNKKSRESAKRSSLKSYYKLRKRLFAKFGNKCNCCGEGTFDFLEIDHVNGGGRAHFASKSTGAVYREILKGGISREYQLLCANCNRGRQRNGGLCPHENV